MQILILDNYDSFTYNLVHIIKALGHSADIYRNDKIELEEVKHYDMILLSPGPGIPDEAGIMKLLIQEYSPSKRILGVCLGHQGIAEIFGAKLFNLPEVLHGVASHVEIIDRGEYLFNNVSDKFQAAHYHSWAVVPDSVTPVLKITATNDDGLIMGLSHTRYDVKGVQFHPESILTPEGPTIIKNWLNH